MSGSHSAPAGGYSEASRGDIDARGVLAALLRLATTSSAMLGVALGLYIPISKRLLGCILALLRAD